MTIKFNQLFITFMMLALVSACSSVGLSNPFGSGNKELSRTPQNATEYVCEGGKNFYVQFQTNGSDAWLIYPDHEVGLSKVAGSSNQFGSGAITLSISGDATTLNDGEKTAYTACKAQVKK